MNVDIEGVVIFDLKSGIPLFSRLGKDMDSSLFSSFVAAIGHFSRELKLGSLASFTTEEKMIFLATHANTITALITPTRKEWQEANALANDLGQLFEDGHYVPGCLQPEEYSGFQPVAEEFLRKIKNPFESNVASFIHKKYGGSISFKPRLMKESGSEGTVDLLVNLGVRYDDDYEAQKNGKGTQDIYSDAYIFCKVSEGRVTRGEVMEFIDSLDGFGVQTMKKDNLEFVPYFPTRAVIIAREYTEPVFDYLNKLPRENGSFYVDGSHVFAGRRIKHATKNTRCIVEVYKWQENDEPIPMEF